MGLNRVRLGDLIEQTNERNEHNRLGITSVRGISIQKKFINTKADMDGVSLSPYKVVRPGDFAYITVTSRNGEKVSFAFNDSEETFLVSSSYVVFRVARQDVLNSTYLTMYFFRPEFDRFARFNSWGSARETFTWEDLCAMEIDLPPLEIQQKYVAVYRAMLANQACYERGLDDLKLTCDAYIEQLRQKYPRKKIGDYIEQVKETNSTRQFSKVRGVDSSSAFIETRAKMQGVDVIKYTVVRRGDFAYNPSRINLGSIAMYDDLEPCIVSPMYEVFRVSRLKELCPEYLMMWLRRKEFQRYTLFNASGSVRDAFDLTSMKEVEIPIPPMAVQVGIVGVYKSYIQRTNLGKKINNLLIRLCPILIKGSIEEVQKKETLNGFLF